MERIEKPRLGEVRMRSNVCLSPTDWHLVPGDLIEAFELPLGGLTRVQANEVRAYMRCSICKRTVGQFNREGCDYCATGGHGVISVAEAKRRQAIRDADAEVAAKASV